MLLIYTIFTSLISLIIILGLFIIKNGFIFARNTMCIGATCLILTLHLVNWKSSFRNTMFSYHYHLKMFFDTLWVFMNKQNNKTYIKTCLSPEKLDIYDRMIELRVYLIKLSDWNWKRVFHNGTILSQCLTSNVIFQKLLTRFVRFINLNSYGNWNKIFHILKKISKFISCLTLYVTIITINHPLLIVIN